MIDADDTYDFKFENIIRAKLRRLAEQQVILDEIELDIAAQLLEKYQAGTSWKELSRYTTLSAKQIQNLFMKLAAKTRNL